MNRIRSLVVVCAGFMCGACGTSPPPPPIPSAADGRGTASVHPDQPAMAGSTGTWDFAFSVGPGGIPVGGGIVFQVSPFWGWSPPQTADPDRPGFCTVTGTCACSLVWNADPEGMYLLIEPEDRPCAEGDTITIRYGDTQDGLRPRGAAKVEPYAEHYQEFLFKTDGDGDGVFGEILRQPGIPVEARPASALWVNGPSLVAPGEWFRVTVAALDEAGNLDTGYRGHLAIRASARAEAPALLRMGPDQAGAGWFEAMIPVPGLVVFTAVDTGAELRASSNPVLCGPGTRFQRVFWGDIHGHTGLSDGTGIPADYYRYARDAAGLDVASVSDHDAWGFRPLLGASWDSLTRVAARYYDPGRFVTLLAYEWTNWTFGHRNVYFRSDSGAVLPYNDPATSTPEGLWRALDPWDAITVAHHVGGGPIGIDWDHRPPSPQEMLVEVYSVHGNCEYWRCPGMIYSPVEGKFVQDALARGYRLGIIASGDGHIGHPGRCSPSNTQGLVAFQADTLTREAIWQALTTRRVYGTSGVRILLEFTINGLPMGSELPDEASYGPRVGAVSAVGTTPISRLEVIKNGSVCETFPVQGIIESAAFVDSVPGTSGDYYYARVTQADGHQAWSSPIWVGTKPRN